MTTAELQLHEPYTDIKAELAKLEVENEAAVFDYRDPAGNKAARSHVYSLRPLRARVREKKSQLKADALEYCARVESVAKELDARILAMIEVHQEPLDRIADEEEERKAAIQNAIDSIDGGVFADGYDATAAEWGAEIDRLEAYEITAEEFQERMAEATTLKRQTLETMRGKRDARLKRDEEQAELARLRAEAEERERKEREARIAAEAAEKAKREAEERAQRERAEAERKAQAEREAAAKREQEAKERADRAEREAQEAEARAKAEAERAEREAKEAEARAKADADRRVREAEEAAERKAQAEREEAARREANKKHVAKIKREAVAALDKVKGSTSADIINAIASGKVAHVTMQF